MYERLALSLLFSAGIGFSSAGCAAGGADLRALSDAERAQAKAVAKACRQEIREHCKGVQAGEGRILACLDEHAEALSDRCAQAIDEAQAALGDEA